MAIHLGKKDENGKNTLYFQFAGYIGFEGFIHHMPTSKGRQEGILLNLSIDNLVSIDSVFLD